MTQQPAPVPQAQPSQEIAGFSTSIGEMTLAQIAGLDMTGVKEFRFENLPVGAFLGRLEKFDFAQRERKDKPKLWVATFTFEVLDVKALVDAGVDAAPLLGKKHNEGFKLESEEDFGRLKAFFLDIGTTGSGTIMELGKQKIGTDYVFTIGHRKDKQNADIVYANIRKIQEQPTALAPAQPAAA